VSNSQLSRGTAAAAVHAALRHHAVEHGVVVVLGARPGQIEEECDLVVRDAGRTEVKPGTVTAGVWARTRPGRLQPLPLPLPVGPIGP
jgi:PTH2 family peptidyl-tRNA hydrolase